MANLGIPGQHINTLAYVDERLSSVPVVQAPRRPAVTDKKYPLWCEWRTNKFSSAPADEGEFWKLVRFESNGDATWVRFLPGGTSSGLQDINDQVGTGVTPDPITFIIDIDGQVVTNGSNPSGIPLETVADVATHTLDVQIQLSAAVAPTPGDANDAGISSFNSNQFQVDATSGMVSLKGSTVIPPIINLTLDDGLSAVANAFGVINIFGTTVANATHAKPLFTYRNPLSNDVSIDLQVATAIGGAPADTNDAGICSFDTTDFSVDANGYVTLNGSIGFNWVEETGATRALIVNQGVIGNRGTAQTFTLPATAALGSTFRIINKGAGLITIAQNAGQSINLGSATSTVGVGGSLTAVTQFCSISFVCTTADTTFTVIDAPVGLWDVV